MAADDKKNFSDNIRLIQQQNDALKAQRDLSLSINDLGSARAKQEEINLNNQKLINDLKSKGSKLTEDEKKLLSDIEKSQGGINNKLTDEQKLRKTINSTLTSFNSQLKSGFQYLMQSDKIIRQTILSLGMSGTKAELMRNSFEQSAGFVASLGGNIEDIQTVMQGFADETGRARVLSAEMVKDIAAIGKGTGLGIEQATRLGSQFELIGLDAKSTMNFVQGIVDTTERMGVNTTKVLKNVNDNFKRLNTYTFQSGAKGIAQMAASGEKLKVSMTDALNAADIAKSLEGAIDLAAQLQVMGGEFAKTDPFEMLFLSRNDPAKFTEKISDMTKGVVSFRKMADGTFEKFISPADRDRLAAVAKSLGMQASELTQIAQRRAELDKMNSELSGTGLTGREKELIKGAAIFNSKSSKFQVELGGQMRDISSLTKTEAEAFAKQSVSLEDRAKAAQDLESAFKASIAELKTGLLPILQGINKVMVSVRPYAEGIIKFLTGPQIAPAWLKVAATFMAASVAFKASGMILNKVAGSLVGKLPGFGGATPTIGKNGLPLNQGAQRAFDVGQVNKMNAGGALAKGQGLKALGMGVGVGAAAAGVGGGIAIAAVGLSKLADSMSKLTDKQADTLKSIATTLAITFPAAAIGIALVAGSATAGAVGLLALGAAVLMVGGGIGVAAAGIGYMGDGLSKLVTAGKGAGASMLSLGAGIATLAGSMALFTTGGLGLLVFAGTMKTIAGHADAIARVGDAFKQINTVMSGSKEDFIAVKNAVESISNMNTKGGSIFAEISKLLKNGVKVEFTDKQVAVVSNITMNIDGYKFHEATKTGAYIRNKNYDGKAGLTGNG